MRKSKFFRAYLSAGAVTVTTIVFFFLSHSLDTGNAASASQQRVRWTPSPTMGSLSGSVSGGRRGQEIAACGQSDRAPKTAITLLVPGNGNQFLTTSARPDLSWYVQTSQPVSTTFVLTAPNQAQPIVSQTMTVNRAGIVTATLPTDFSLPVGTRYRWTVVVACQENPANQVYARSFIERVDNPAVAQALLTKTQLEKATVYAQNGIWYDALAALVQAYQSDPVNGSIKAELRSLLEQADSQPTNGSAERLAHIATKL